MSAWLGSHGMGRTVSKDVQTPSEASSRGELGRARCLGIPTSGTPGAVGPSEGPSPSESRCASPVKRLGHAKDGELARSQQVGRSRAWSESESVPEGTSRALERVVWIQSTGGKQCGWRTEPDQGYQCSTNVYRRTSWFAL